MGKLPFRSLWKQEQGISLVEAIVAIAVTGTVIVATLQVLSQAVRATGAQGDTATLLRVAQNQVETIQQSPFQEDPSNYPTLENLPGGFIVTFSATTTDTTYVYPEPDQTVLSGVIQKITVTAKGPSGEADLTFFKVRSP